MIQLNVGDLRRVIKDLKDKDPVLLSLADPPDGSNWKLDGFTLLGDTLLILASDKQAPMVCRTCTHQAPEAVFSTNGKDVLRPHICPRCGSVYVEKP